MAWLAIIGLSLNTAGAIIIWRFGFPQPSHEEGVASGLEDATVFADGSSVAEINRKVRERRKRYQIASNIGIGLLVLGFVLQLASLLT